MEKMRMETKDLMQENIEKIGKLFPNVITEMKDENGNLKKGVNFELLKQELSKDIVEHDEHFEFTWVGKMASIVEANTPIRKTLRPCIEESKNWETTENIYIEGDNLDVLKLLQESYLGKIKMIYIDPPYNTGNDSFVYPDKYEVDKEEYEEEIQFRDEEENINFRQNSDSNPRFHSDWCSMMYSRLKLSRCLLSEDGVIFISIDDHELTNLKNICDEVFGEDNFLSHFIWKRRTSSAMADNNISVDHEYVISYKNNKKMNFIGDDKRYIGYSNPDNDPRGLWIHGDITIGMSASQRPNQAYDLVDPQTGKVYPYNPNRVWSYIPETMSKLIEENRIIFPEDTSKRPSLKRFKNELKNLQNPISSIIIDKVDLNSQATRMMREIMGVRIFEYSKPLSLIKILISQINFDADSIILDFFSGSATTAHAVMQLNTEDGGNRKFIMVQLPEACPEDSEAFKAGYKNIAEIGKERIRRAGEKIMKEVEEENQKNELIGEQKKVPDIGFRVFKVDSTNVKEVFYSANEYSQEKLIDLESNIKEDRTDLDLLYGVLLEWGLSLSLPHETKKIDDITIHIVDHDALIACFSENVTEKVVREIAQFKPLRVVFRDSCFSSSPEKINIEEIFKLLSPNTSVKVL